MSTLAIIAVAVVGAVLLSSLVLLIVGMTMASRASDELSERRALSQLPDHSSTEAWRQAAAQSQAVADARRGENGKTSR
jgi:hypothetical protein